MIAIEVIIVERILPLNVQAPRAMPGLLTKEQIQEVTLQE
jgi:hypothetical protein